MNIYLYIYICICVFTYRAVFNKIVPTVAMDYKSFEMPERSQGLSPRSSVPDSSKDSANCCEL